MRLAIVGVAVGLAAAFGLAKLIAMMVYGVTAWIRWFCRDADRIERRRAGWGVATGAAPVLVIKSSSPPPGTLVTSARA